MEGTGTRYQKRLHELRGLYADVDAFEKLAATREDDVVYEVTDHRPNANRGDLITGLTRMSPGKVGDEFFMTRGHIHATVDRPEICFGLKGCGLILIGITRRRDAHGGDKSPYRLLCSALLDSPIDESR